MRVRLLSSVPSQPPLRTYETAYLYVGFGRYDTERKTLTKITVHSNTEWDMTEVPFAAHIFPRSYHAEMVRVTIYSESPRVWSEFVDDQLWVFQQQTD
jgi:hypothetical protein